MKHHNTAFHSDDALTEERCTMLKSFQNTRVLSLVFGATAFIALVSVAPVTPAAAQGVPDALRRLDPPQSFNGAASLTDAQQTKVRSAYDRVRKHHHVAAQ
jgi:transcriptional regulator of nitric oxide reductase